MRAAVVLVLLAGFAAADGRVRLDEAQQAKLVEIVGERTWASLPAWRQSQAGARFYRFLRAPERKRRAIRTRGLRAYLLAANRRVDASKLPKPLRAAVKELPKSVQPAAARLAFLRLRQLQFDRSLRRIPDVDRRWALFNARFPEPYDEMAAARAHKQIRSEVVRAVAREIGKRLEAKDLTPEQRKQMLGKLVKQTVQREQEQVFGRIRRELFKFSSRDAKAWRGYLEQYHFIEGIRNATPRQRELIRYAFRPHDCPLLDMSFLGPRPSDPAERRAWERDFITLARIDLLDAAGFPAEFVLYLAGTGSPADFFRAVQGLRRAERPAVER